MAVAHGTVDGLLALRQQGKLPDRATMAILRHEGRLFVPQALQDAESYLLQTQMADGSWWTSVVFTIEGVRALSELGYTKDSAAIQTAMAFLRSRQRADGQMGELHVSNWETAWAVHALWSAGRLSQDDYWPLMQVFERGRVLQSGWGGNDELLNYPDHDDTAAVLLALVHVNGGDTAREEMESLLRRQHEDGGWGSFTQTEIGNQAYQRFLKWYPVNSVRVSFQLDPSVPDVTSHVLMAMGANGFRTGDPHVTRAVYYLREVQFEDGKWFGAWGLPYIYGTGHVLVGLHAVGADMSEPWIQRAVTWLKQHQNKDGGWGETFEALVGPSHAGNGNSTAPQTAWALMGLLSAGESTDSTAVKNAIAWLVKNQQGDGAWPACRCMWYPPYMHYNYPADSVMWELMALEHYRQLVKL